MQAWRRDLISANQNQAAHAGLDNDTGPKSKRRFSFSFKNSFSKPHMQGNEGILQNRLHGENDVPRLDEAAMKPPQDESISGADISKPPSQSRGPRLGKKKQPKAKKGHLDASAAAPGIGSSFRRIFCMAPQTKEDEDSGYTPDRTQTPGYEQFERNHKRPPEPPIRKLADTSHAHLMQQRCDPSKAEPHAFVLPTSESKFGTSARFSPMSEAVRRKEWTAPPDAGFKTGTLRQELSEAYGIWVGDVQMALDLADSVDMAKTYCLAYCLTGGPMDVAQRRVLACNFSDAVLLNRHGNLETGLDSKLLTADQQAIKRKAIEMHTEKVPDNAQQPPPPSPTGASTESTPNVGNASRPGDENGVMYEDELTPEQEMSLDAEEKAWAEKTKDKSMEDALLLLGLPGPPFTKDQIYTHLNPFTVTTSTYEQRLRQIKFNLAIDTLQKSA